MASLIALAPLAACGGGGSAGNNAETAAAATPAPTPTPAGRILDAANLLSDTQKAELSAKLGSLELRTQRKVVIATVESLGGRPIDDVVEEMGTRLGVHDGVVLLVASRDRKVRLAVGLGARGLLTPGETRGIVDKTMYPDLHANRFDLGIMRGADRIIAELSETTA